MLAVICEDLDLFESVAAGAIYYLEGSALIKCPGCGSESVCDERRGGNHPSWVMDKLRHTWQPSVHHSKDGCGWHGWLREGAWEPC